MRYLWKRNQRSQTATDSLRQLASAGNYDCVVEHISSDGGNLNNTDKYGRTILHWAVIEGKFELVTSLLERQDIEIGTTDWLGKPAIYYAVICEDKEMVQLFLNKKHGKKGENPPRDKDGRTALHDALDSGSNGMAELCLEQELISLPDSCGRTPLIHAARTGNTSMLQHLHSHGASIDSSDEEKGRTALHWAAYCGSEEMVKELVLMGADVTAKDHDGHTALHMAAANGHLLAATLLLENKKLQHEHAAMSKLLIESMSNIEERDAKGNTLLHWAALKSNATVVEVMLHSLGERDAAILAMQGEYDETPLHVATFHNDTAMIKVMMKHLGEKSDAILMKQDGGKRTALHLAAQRDIAAPVKVSTLLECLKENAGAMMMIPDRWGWTPLHHAAKCGNTGAFEVMLECLKEKASTVMVMLDLDNRTPLHWAASRCDAGTVKMILECLETEVACPLMAMEDIHNRTPLHLAAKGGHTATVKVMLEYLGEDASAIIILRDDQGNTPLHWAAAENDNEATVVAILEYLADTSIAGNAMDIMDHKKCTPLHLAARRGKVPMIKAMLRYLNKTEGASCLTMMDDDGMLPLEYPVAKKLVQETEFIIETGPKQETDNINR
ncbi:ankyrin repeat protein [Beauveria bassiana ARSEF 2860]|uniref:protein S-acyltransferase n=1 Tax=Beauveria bassiana (strain ARSEF 2860) TaxID=655819 RepID=J4UP48_BEAB2|nr:ankyrin repeat protein [Beauveria bassiana ARSEF 2860]EJP66917.1 ankyrin repeat protein [Beauveria bassiana ARSEF 2860]